MRPCRFLRVRTDALKIETQFLENHQAKLIVELENEPLEDAKRRAARKLAKQVKIPGFRPGKAPYNVIVRHVGEGTILEEATEILVNDFYPKAIEEADIHPYGPGELENIPSMDPPKFEFVVPLRAEVTLGNYKEIRLPYEPKEVKDEDVDAVLTDMRNRQAVSEPVERAAQEGDIVYMHLSGERKQAEEGQDPTLIKERSLSVVIDPEGEDHTDEWPFPGFSRNLISLQAGDQKDLAYTFSDDTPYESLRGIDAEYHLTVDEVKSRNLPELNDEFSQSIGEYETMEDLTGAIRSSLEEQAKETYNSDYDDQILDQLVGQSTIKYPPQMLDREIDEVIESLKNRLEQQNLDIDLYLKTREMDMDGLKEEARPVAIKRLERALVLLELSESENVQVKPEEVQDETARTMNEIARTLPKSEAYKLSNRDVVSSLVGNIMMDMVTDRTLERLRQIARGEVDAEVEPASDGEEAAAEAEETGTEPVDKVAADFSDEDTSASEVGDSSESEVDANPDEAADAEGSSPLPEDEQSQLEN
jgi:trigger factor